MSYRAAQAAKNVYRGYMPIDLPQHRKNNRVKPWWKVLGKPRVTVYPKQELEPYSEEPEYPPLNDVSAGGRKAVRNQIRLDWYDHLQRLPTFDQKMCEIGKHTSHYIAHINNWLPVYNSLPMIEYLTNTVLVDSLPDNYNVSGSTAEDGSQELIEQIKKIILDQVALDKFQTVQQKPHFVPAPIRDGNRKACISNRLIQNIVSDLRKTLAIDANPQLMDYQFDLSPAIRSWWFHSGLAPPNNKVFYKARQDEDGNINQIIQMDGSSAVNIRHDSMIEPIISQTDPLVTDTALVKRYRNPLMNYGSQYKFKQPVALPGFWPEETPKFDLPHTSFLSMDCLEVREAKNYKIVKPLSDHEICLNGQAILTAFGWTNGLSMYHGFTPYHELHYPLTCQIVTTNGQDWLFNVYQLNCHSFHRDQGGPKCNNICWSSGKMQLYRDFVDGQFTGVNDDVVKLVVRFLSQKTSPEYTSQLNLRPYLGISNQTDEERLETKKELRRQFEQRSNRWLLHDWKVPLFEHIFFRSKVGRNRIRHMKPKFHIPKPTVPEIFK